MAFSWRCILHYNTTFGSKNNIDFGGRFGKQSNCFFCKHCYALYNYLQATLLVVMKIEMMTY